MLNINYCGIIYDRGKGLDPQVSGDNQAKDL